MRSVAHLSRARAPGSVAGTGPLGHDRTGCKMNALAGFPAVDYDQAGFRALRFERLGLTRPWGVGRIHPPLHQKNKAFQSFTTKEAPEDSWSGPPGSGV